MRDEFFRLLMRTGIHNLHVGSEEKGVLLALAGELGGHLEDRDVAWSPFVALRAFSVVLTVLSVLDLSRALWGPQEETEELPNQRAADRALFETFGKAQERLRRAMNEFEDLCEKAGAPARLGLPDIMKPILKKAEGVMEKAIAIKQREDAEREASGTRASD